MFSNIIKKIKDSLVIEESFFICEETKYHPVVNEVTNSYLVVKIDKIAGFKVRQETLFSDVKTIEEAEKYRKVYKDTLAKKRSAGIVLVKENSL